MNTNISFAAASKDYQKGQYLKSLEILNKLVDTQQDVKTYVLLAKNLAKLGFKNEAASAYALAGGLDSQPESAYTREAALLYYEIGNEEEALLNGLRVMQRARNEADLAYILASIHLKQGRKDLISPYRKVLSESSNPEHVVLAVRLLSDELVDVTNWTLVQNLFKKLPHIPALRLLNLVFTREVCDYELVEKLFAPVREMIESGDYSILQKDNPFYHLHWCADEKLNQLASFKNLPLEQLAARRKAVPHSWGKKIRIGYMSSDFWENHATMKLLQNVLELHDRDRFEVTLFCHTPENYIATNKTDRSAWGEVCTIRDLSNEETATAIREKQIDILVDLKGYTAGGRPDVLNFGAAPIQVAWLGFPGSIVNIDLDYAIGDRFVLPMSSAPHYHEKFVHMPDSYQPNDTANRPRPKPMSRAELGLPENAFVFASFNANRKITAETLDVWCNILKRTPGSVLWLMLSSARVRTNMVNYMSKQGIGADRVIFCERVEYQEHINRQSAADLGIDTFPVNGHTTTSEQLWGGLPVLTVKGTNFASRVSESLLNAVGLPELVAADLQAYEDMAVGLAQDPERLNGYRQRLKQNAGIMPLFDSDRFRQHLEKAYELMIERAKQGLGPDHIAVPALPARTEPFVSLD
ncbi:glycosyl transferase [Rhizobium sp. S152]|uniref:O-linked N-acetylglucosamine transferase, SPINDLY family protein n=1 Tax=Rhizobium sp. S152 TaxID=3055038 RepID=UPI0025A9B0C9|nr:glycosyltransferase family 41 protein [Rhizobium sp. S152]MDM9626401.1 glycosyl transferase [Rhizobium sp. S152]